MPDHPARREILKLVLNNHEREMPGSVDPQLLTVKFTYMALYTVKCYLLLAAAYSSAILAAMCGMALN